MNIVLATGIYPPEIGGPATFTRGLAQYLTTQGHTVSVVTYGDERTELGNTFPVYVISRVFGPAVRYCRYAWKVFRLAQEVDIVFAQGPVSEGLPARVAAFLARKPFYLKVVGDVAWESAQRSGNEQTLDDFLKQPQASIKVKMIMWVERFVARRANTVITPSRYLRGVVQAWGVPEERIAVIYNAVHKASPDLSVEILLDTYQLTNKRILFCGGRLVPWKRIDLLLRMMVIRPSSEVLVVAGEGSMSDNLKQLAISLGVSDRVIWLGRCSSARMVSWYQFANKLLLPSLYEGLPHMVLEAAMYGCPSLVSRWGGNPEAKELHPDLVEVVHSDEPEAWSAAVEKVMSREQGSIQSWTQTAQMAAYADILSTSLRMR